MDWTLNDGHQRSDCHSSSLLPFVKRPIKVFHYFSPPLLAEPVIETSLDCESSALSSTRRGRDFLASDLCGSPRQSTGSRRMKTVRCIPTPCGV